MPTDHNAWPLSQLQRLSETDPDRARVALESLFERDPDLLKDLAAMAVDGGELSVEAALDETELSNEELDARLASFRNRSFTADRAVVYDSESRIARTAAGIPVWEVVRAFRRLGSVESLTAAFPALSTAELAVALRYAQEHPAEIEAQIARFEGMREKRWAEYPFAL